MEPATIRLRENGPYVVQGTFTLVDPDGNEFALPAGKPAVALCRCGHSQNRPFCDGSHRAAGFHAGERAAPPADH